MGIIERIKNNKLVTITVAWIVFSIIAIILAVAFFHDFGDNARGPNDDTASIVDEGEEGAVELPEYDFAMNNRSELSSAISNINSMVVFDNIREIVISQSERESAPEKNNSNIEGWTTAENGYFYGTIRNLVRDFNPSDASGSSSIVSFELAITDGRVYHVNVITGDSSGYIATLIQREGKNNQWLFINSFPDMDAPESEIMDWVSALGFDSSELVTKRLRRELPEF